MTTLVQETDSHYVMDDGRSKFRVPKAGLSEKLHSQIRAMAPKMADGGEVDFTGPENRKSILDAFSRGREPQYFGKVTDIAPGETPEQAAARVGGVYVKRPTQAEVKSTLADVADAEQAKANADLYKAEAERAQVQQLKTQSQPVAPIQPKRQQAAQPKPPAMPDGFAEQEAAIRARGALESEAKRQLADAQAEGIRRLEQHEIAAREMHARAAEAARVDMEGIQRARDDIKKIDMSVDPGRFWATRSTPGKIAGIIGLVLGALGARNDGVNHAAGLINQAIDRDLEAQKTEHELRFRQGQAALEGATSAYSMHRQQGLDDIAAHSATKGTLLEIAAMKADQIASSAASPMAKNQADMLSAELHRSKQVADEELKQRAFDNRLKGEHLNIEKTRAAAEMLRAQNEGHGAGQTKTQQELGEIERRAEVMRTNLTKAKAIIEKAGTFELTGPEQGELKKALTDYAIDSAKMKDPTSAAKESEVETELNALGVKPGAILTSNKTAQSLLDNAIADINTRLRVARSSRGTAPSDSASSSEANEARQWLMANPSDPRAPAIRRKYGL